MLTESISLKMVAALSGAVAGLTVLVRLGRLLEALEAVQERQKALEAKMDRALEAIAHLEGRTE